MSPWTVEKRWRGRQALMIKKVYVDLSAAFRPMCQSTHLVIELENREATLEGLLRWLSRKYGERMQDLLFEKGTMSILPGLMVVVNDRIHTGVALNVKDVPLMEGDRVSLLYFISGG
ncbi:MAG: MoaD/ThiS family protein [Deltaproteobacteria bacterium]|nr:MoaD/ThiS family protein [Deltaproteobacteria bacterium]